MMIVDAIVFYVSSPNGFGNCCADDEIIAVEALIVVMLLVL